MLDMTFSFREIYIRDLTGLQIMIHYFWGVNMTDIYYYHNLILSLMEQPSKVAATEIVVAVKPKYQHKWVLLQLGSIHFWSNLYMRLKSEGQSQFWWILIDPRVRQNQVPAIMIIWDMLYCYWFKHFNVWTNNECLWICIE